MLKTEDIAFLYEIDGRFLGEVIVRCFHLKDQNYIKSKNMKELGKRYIEIFDSTYEDWKLTLES